MTRRSLRPIVSRSFPYLCLALLLIAAAFLINPQHKAEAAATFTVNDMGDTDDAIQGDGVCADSNNKCTLRAAIEEANALAGADTIKFSVTGTIKLTLGELVVSSDLTVTGPGASALTVDANQASRVFHINYATVTLDSLTIANGKHSSVGEYLGGGDNNVGGGIFNEFGTLTITNSTISNNSASSDVNAITNLGGGIFNEGGTLTITNSTISNNSASGSLFSHSYGGGIANTLSSARLTITNSTISNNSVSSGLFSQGGAIYNRNATSTITNSTISNNSASSGIQGNGGGIATETSRAVNTRNTIIAGNIADRNPDVSGEFTSQGHNLIGKNENRFSGFTDGINNDQVGTVAMPLDPHLAPLQYYGGPTQTMALLPNSPAINAGDDCVTDALHCFDSNITQLTTDQRGTGFPRKSGAHVDIGAFEFRTVPEQIADLMALIDNFNVKKGVDNKFDHRLDEVLKKLNEMQRALDRGNTYEASDKKRVACQQLADLINKAQKETGKKLSTLEANQIIVAVNLIRVTLGC